MWQRSKSMVITRPWSSAHVACSLKPAVLSIIAGSFVRAGSTPNRAGMGPLLNSSGKSRERLQMFSLPTSGPPARDANLHGKQPDALMLPEGRKHGAE